MIHFRNERQPYVTTYPLNDKSTGIVRSTPLFELKGTYVLFKERESGVLEPEVPGTI